MLLANEVVDFVISKGRQAIESAIMEKVIEGRDYSQEYAFECSRLFAETEGLIMAPETAHAAAAAIDEAKGRNEKRVIAFNYSGHGLLDLEGYQRILKLGQHGPSI